MATAVSFVAHFRKSSNANTGKSALQELPAAVDDLWAICHRPAPRRPRPKCHRCATPPGAKNSQGAYAT